MTIQPALKRRRGIAQYLKENWVFYLFILPAFLDILIFWYFPLYGIQISFRDYKIRRGMTGSEWVGLEYFVQFIESPNFIQLMRNTLLLSFYNLLFGFPVPIVLAIMINEIHQVRLKKTVQMITYMPHFISLVAIVGLIDLMLDRESGIINLLLQIVGGGAHRWRQHAAKDSLYRSAHHRADHRDFADSARRIHAERGV